MRGDARPASALQGGAAPRLRVGFILARRFTLCAFANFVDVLRLAADEGDRSRPILCEWSILSDSMDPVASSCGVMVQPTARLADPAVFDYVVVVGGLMEEVAGPGRPTLHFLQRAAAARVPLVGVCTGTFILHRAGLMDGYRACVSWFHHADFLAEFGGLTPVSDQIFVVDRDRLTCSGGVSSAHLAAHLVERHVGPAQARKSLEIMIIDGALRGEEPQPHIPVALPTALQRSDELVRKALVHMHEAIAAPLTVDEIARRVGASRRQLERRFMATVQATPGAVYTAMRLDQAEMMLRDTGQSVAAVAAATGFCDASHLTRTLRRRRGATPAAFRAGAVAVSCSAAQVSPLL